ncbi:SMI1/KNR4 family protein [Arcobacter sp. CECT 8985]|uniref:SMI1/KNR4 family protein n=1 Tax=Arcobacter sp. CECT 8985 TaxID=1935424 RepID=UPI00100A42CE|nr:SMI1/KNR4 family protein [Arcobacter sp. CECT 8985]RXJ88087.1 hypothetical protein CRU93_00385 [Arcobacter sp. CECT 8985]
MNEIEHIIAKNEEIWTSTPVSLTVINECETRLDLKFPPSYRTFLSKFGTMDVAGNFISGIIDNSLDDLGGGSVLGDTLYFREECQLPNNLIVIQADDEAPYCLDINNGDSECVVVCFELHSGHSKVIASSFLEWIGLFVLGASND